MLLKLKTRLSSIYHVIVSSIAFYPTLLSVFLLFLAFAMLTIEDNDLTKFLLDKAPYLVISNAETARAILATLIGGIISLTVFSFSMVMVLLNQASTNFSPRLLPGLISDKRNQIVLGIYIGTILYNIIVLISILPSGDTFTIQGFSILVGIVLGIVCLALFVFFIHSISTGIQINNILQEIFVETCIRLGKLLDNEVPDASVKTFEDGIKILSTQSGYITGLDQAELLEMVKEEKIDLIVLPYEGQYVQRNEPIFLVNRNLGEDKMETLRDLVRYTSKQSSSNNYVIGIKQIAEVGVKAMSPGINDPGTAVMTLDFITELLCKRMSLSDYSILSDKDSDHYVQLGRLSFENLIYYVLASYRQYCKHDVLLMEKIVVMLMYLKQQHTPYKSNLSVLDEQLDIVQQDIVQHISNEGDQKRLIALCEIGE